MHPKPKDKLFESILTLNELLFDSKDVYTTQKILFNRRDDYNIEKFEMKFPKWYITLNIQMQFFISIKVKYKARILVLASVKFQKSWL
jgi:hypothetical protein